MQSWCHDEPDPLSHYNGCPFLYNFGSGAWRNAAVLPRRGYLFHDLITQIFPRILQYAIVVRSILEHFLYAHNHHRRNFDNPAIFGRRLHGRENPPMRPSLFAWRSALLLFPVGSFAFLLPKPGIRIFPTLEPLHLQMLTANPGAISCAVSTSLGCCFFLSPYPSTPSWA